MREGNHKRREIMGHTYEAKMTSFDRGIGSMWDEDEVGKSRRMVIKRLVRSWILNYFVSSFLGY